MKRIEKIVREFSSHWKNYLLQSFIATIAIFIVITSLSIQEHPIFIASIGATTFIVFAMPNDPAAKPVCIIGGHIVGLACGFLCALIPHTNFISPIVAESLIYALAVGLSIFVMVVTDTEHPPAAGTALGTAIKGLSLSVTLGIVVSAVILSLIHYLFRKHLKDLT